MRRRREFKDNKPSKQGETGLGTKCPGPKFCGGCYEVGYGKFIHPPKTA